MATESLLTKKQLIEKLKTFDSYKETKDYILNKELKADLIEKLEKVSKKPIAFFEVGINPKVTKKAVKETLKNEEVPVVEEPTLNINTNLTDDLSDLEVLSQEENVNETLTLDDIG